MNQMHLPEENKKMGGDLLILSGLQRVGGVHMSVGNTVTDPIGDFHNWLPVLIRMKALLALSSHEPLRRLVP